MSERQGDLFDDNPLREAFEEFHESHPDVWDLFERRAFDRIRAGQKHYSARLIWTWISFHFETSSQEAPKLNNNHSPFYARLFMERHPEHSGFFETRRSAADKQEIT